MREYVNMWFKDLFSILRSCEIGVERNEMFDFIKKWCGVCGGGVLRLFSVFLL